MKKKFLLGILLCTISTSSLLACGKDINSDSNSVKNEQTPINDDADISEVELVSETEDNSVPHLYEKSDEWNSVEPDDFAIQILDKIFTTGKSMDELMQNFSSSKIEYDLSDYNPHKITTEKDVDIYIPLTIDEDAAVYVHAFNPDCNAEIELSNWIVNYYALSENELAPYCRFIDGRSYDEILSLTEDEVLNLQNTILSGFEQSYGSGDTYCIEYSKDNGKYVFVIDVATKKVSDFYCKLDAGAHI